MNKPILITLTTTEIMMAGHAGMMRQVLNIKKGIEHRHGGHQDQSWQYHLEGALGEYALAKYLNVNWAGVGVEARAPDVGVVDVRTTAGHNNRLMIHPDDKDDRQYWLVTGVNGEYKIRGWIMGIDGKQPEYWDDPVGKKGGKKRPAFFVPQDALNPIEDTM